MASQNPIRGKTIDWTFSDGQLKGKTVTHTFKNDGTVSFSMPGSDQETEVEKCLIARVSDSVYAVSYQVPGGYTLVVDMNLDDKSLVAFSMKGGELEVQHGKFELKPGRAATKDQRPN